MNKPKVSVVVPIYNVEKYLPECIDSILNQTLKEIEVILIDDGSPDNCGEIIDEYAQKDSRIVAVHQKNSGYSVAVNKGIDLAKGEYVGIIESDDWIEKNMYEELYKSAKENKTDITKGCFTMYDSTKPKGKQDKFYKNPYGIDLRLAPNKPFRATDWPKIIAFHASIWSSIYEAKFIKSIKIPETAGASYQDFPFMAETLSKAKRITVVKKPFVHWRNEPSQGNSTSARGKKLTLMAENSRTAVDITQQYGTYDQLKEYLFFQIVLSNHAFFFNIQQKYRREYYDKLKAVLEIAKNDPTFKGSVFRKPEWNFFNLITQRSFSYISAYAFVRGSYHAVRSAGGRVKKLFIKS